MAHLLGMRVLRCALWFLVGVLFSTWATFSYAETIPSTATSGDSYEGMYYWEANNPATGVTGKFATAQQGVDHDWAGVEPMPVGYCTISKGAATPVSYQGSTTRYKYTAQWTRSNCTGGYTDGTYTYDSGSRSTYKRTTSCATGYSWDGTHCRAPSTYSCPDSSWTLSSDQLSCTRPDCPTGQVRDASGSCVYENCKSGRKLDAGLYTDSDGNGINKSACVAGCLAYYSGATTPVPYVGVGSGGATGEVYIGQYNDTGMKCTQTDPVEEKSETPPEDTPEYNCIKSGQSFGYVNGQAVCLPKSSDAAAPTTSADSSTTTNPDGTSSNVTSTETVNEDGTITKETTTTNYDSAGNVTGSTTTAVTSNQGAYCQQNPNSDACQRKEATGGGDCTAAPTCNGDPILCNQLKQNWHQRCETQKTNEFLGQGEQATNDAVSAFEDAVNNPFDKSELEQGEHDLAGMLDTTGFLSGGCVQDKVIALPMGQSLTIPFSALCPYLEYIGWAVIALSAMLALRILGVL